MSFTHKLVTWLLRTVTSAALRIDDSQLEKVPMQGPLILAVNHVNIVDAPAMYTRLMPRPLIAFVKKEAWDNPFERALLSVWGGIPLQRGQADFEAFRQGKEVLDKGYLLTIALEGTRNKDGKLMQAQPGAVLLALRTGTPLLPVVFYGHENIWRNLKKLRRSDFKIIVGEPFTLQAGGQRVSSEMTHQMVDEVMYQLSMLLPEAYRGVYADLSKATTKYLRFENK